MTMLPNRPYLKVQELAEYFSVDKRTIINWIHRGVFMGVQIGGVLRVTRDSVILEMVRGGKKTGKIGEKCENGYIDFE